MLCVTSDDGRAGALPQLEQLVVEALARQGIERAERLVEQQDLRVADERARDRHALAHAARQLVRIRLGEVGDADELEQLARALTTFVAWPTPASWSGNATLSSAVRQGSRRGSWNTSPTRWSASPTGWPSIRIGPSSGSMQAADQAQQRALAGAVRSQHGADAVRRHVEADVVEHEQWRLSTTKLFEMPSTLIAASELSSVARRSQRGVAGNAKTTCTTARERRGSPLLLPSGL